MYENNRLVCVGRDLQDHPAQPHAVGRAATHELRLLRAHPTWPSAPPGMGNHNPAGQPVPVSHNPRSK